MGQYLTLHKHTTEGKENITDAETWLETGTALTESMGGEVVSIYYGNIGEYDAVTVTEFPDAETVEKVRLAFESEGTHETEHHRVFEAEEYLGMIDGLPI